MRILQVIPYFTPRLGGDVNVCSNLSRQLALQGHHVTILTTDFEFSEEYRESLPLVEVVKSGCRARIGFFLYSPGMGKWLDQNIKNYDIIHLQGFRSFQNSQVHAYAKRDGIPYILQAHGTVLPFFEKRLLKRLYDLVWGSRVLGDSSRVIAITGMEADQYQKMGVDPEKITIIPNGIDLSDFRTLPQFGKFRSRFGIGTEEKLVLYLGRLHKRKGIDTLISAFAGLSREIKEVRLAIVGADDGYLASIRNQIKKLGIVEEVTITHFYKDKHEAFVDADLLVYPGLSEIFGLVPFEALMCGTPVIVSDDCGCGEIVKSARCGYTVRYGDSKGLAHCMGHALSHPEETRDLVRNGRRFIEANLDYEQIARRFEEAYFAARQQETQNQRKL